MADLHEKADKIDTVPAGQPSDLHETWPSGTGLEDQICWVCHGPTEYRQCKIVCKKCGFMRDCSDP